MNVRILIAYVTSVTLLLSISLEPTQAVEPNGNHYGTPERGYAHALGIYEAFGRWNQTIKLGYNPANAPTSLSNTNTFLAMLKEAAERWQKISGVSINILTPANYQDDMGNAVSRLDRVVSITWVSSAENFSARVAPRRSSFNDQLGYYPYVDGAITLNSRSNTWENHTRAMRTLTHEIGHLLGLGHSDNPGSMMFANPYNTLQYPTEDDIRADQALYGQPVTAIDPASSLSEWLHVPLPLTSASYLSPVSITAEGSSLVDNVITATTRHDGWLRLETPVNNRRQDSELNRRLELVLIEPNGYVYSRRIREVTCSAGKYCRPWTGIIQMAVLKQLPGNWRIHVNDMASNTRLETLGFQVNTATQYNLPPSARMVVSKNGSTDSVQVKVIANDPENDQISISWSPISTDEILSSNGISEWKTLKMKHAGVNTYFIEVNDSAPRYPGSGSTTSAGSGFRTLLRLEVTFPIKGSHSFHMTSSNMYSYDHGQSSLVTYYRHDSPVYQPSRSWPAPYNGVTPPDSFDLPENNIGLLDTANSALYTCVQIIDSGNPSHIAETDRFDVIFNIVDLNAGIISVSDTRIFNETDTINENFELPDCSGRYDVAKAVYTDTVLIDKQVYQLTFTLRDTSDFEFALVSAQSH